MVLLGLSWSCTLQASRQEQQLGGIQREDEAHHCCLRPPQQRHRYAPALRLPCKHATRSGCRPRQWCMHVWVMHGVGAPAACELHGRAVCPLTPSPQCHAARFAVHASKTCPQCLHSLHAVVPTSNIVSCVHAHAITHCPRGRGGRAQCSSRAWMHRKRHCCWASAVRGQAGARALHLEARAEQAPACMPTALPVLHCTALHCARCC